MLAFGHELAHTQGKKNMTMCLYRLFWSISINIFKQNEIACLFVICPFSVFKFAKLPPRMTNGKYRAIPQPQVKAQLSVLLTFSPPRNVESVLGK